MTVFAVDGGPGLPFARGPMSPLPILPVLPRLLAVLRDRPNAVLVAPPGAGKTTAVPPALLDAPWLAGRRIVMLEPRRLAARAAARRMAEMRGETVGETVGYRMRLDSKVGPSTRIEVVTEGVLTRLIQDDPELSGIGALLFDEFHERSLNADLGLALALDLQAALRPDLRLVAMSATLDGAAVARLMGDAPVIDAEGRAFPVALRWLDRPWPGRLEDGVACLVERALADQDQGDVLAFLPGQAEIRRTRQRLEEAGTDAVVVPLYGDLPAADQDRALAPMPGRRKVILASAIAETSLTVEGVRAVVDGGRSRRPRFDPRTGMSRLITAPVAKASAEQRAGRAGRTAPGICYRLWTEAEHRALAAFAPPEIAESDLAPLALELACWGIADAAALGWLDPPPAAALAQARGLLADLGALDQAGRVTAHGRRMARLGLHPRLAHMALKGAELGLTDLAADLAALLSDRDPGGTERDADLRARIERLRGADGRGPWRRLRESARQIRRRLPKAADREGGTAATGLLLAFAYPDRIALRRSAQALDYRMSNGQGAFFPEPEPLCLEEMLAIADLDGNRRRARIYLAAAVARADIEEQFAGRIVTRDVIAWDDRTEQVTAVRRRLLGELALDEAPLAAPDAEAVRAALMAGIAAMGLGCLPWTAGAESMRARVAFLRRLDGASWPDLSDAALTATLPDWLGPWLTGMSRRAHLARLDLEDILRSRLDWAQRRALDEQAPARVTVPSGSRVAIDYGGETPVLAVRLQEMFGLADTPTVAGGRVRLLLHLLSPARRPVQVTQDLAGFWAGSYKAVKADLKGQYPKHPWPDDPLAAPPTARAKRRGT